MNTPHNKNQLWTQRATFSSRVVICFPGDRRQRPVHQRERSQSFMDVVARAITEDGFVRGWPTMPAAALDNGLDISVEGGELGGFPPDHRANGLSDTTRIRNRQVTQALANFGWLPPSSLRLAGGS
jgi:hypothetical protein